MGLKPIDQIDSDVEDEVLSRHENADASSEEEYVMVFEAGDPVICEMVQDILEQNDIACIKKADDTLGIFGVAMHARLYVNKEDYDLASSLLLECGFLDDREDTDSSGVEIPGENGETEDKDEKRK